jgi:PhzF family phenazine biosynthesis protein
MGKCLFKLVDVFTEKPLEGNQLAVVFDADNLSDEQMLAIAREFNYSETTFVLPRETAKRVGDFVRSRLPRRSSEQDIRLWERGGRLPKTIWSI